MDKIGTTAFGMNGYVYPLIHGEDYFCVPTCIKIILEAIGIDISVQELASFFEVITSTQTTNDLDLGVHVKNGDLDDLFQKWNIPLQEEYIPIDSISELLFSDLLQDLLSQRVHIICGYSFGILFDDPQKIDYGHTSIIIASDSKHVQIINPGPLFDGINTVNVSALYEAIRRRKDGLWIIKQRK